MSKKSKYLCTVEGTDIVPLPSRVSPVSSGDTVTSEGTVAQSCK